MQARPYHIESSNLKVHDVGHRLGASWSLRDARSGCCLNAYSSPDPPREQRQRVNTLGRPHISAETGLDIKDSDTGSWRLSNKLGRIPGNEEADEEAKKAAEGTTTGATHLPKLLRKTLKYSKSAAIQEENMARKKRWTREWITSPRYAKFKHIDASLPSRKFIKLISNTKISRSDASKFFQLRSGHIPLNAYLHRFKRKESAQCPACT